MSVSLQISGKNIPESEWENIPVATESVFEKYWLPLSEDLNLEYVPLFQYGIEIGSDTLNEVLQELKLIKNEVMNKQTDINYKNLSERIDNLIKTLPIYLKKYQTVYIG